MEMSAMNALNWFEIPAADFDRATRFYETTLGKALKRERVGDMELAVFPYDPSSGVGGCLEAGAGCVPGAQGTIVYLDAAPSLEAALKRATTAGGAIALPRTALPEGMGYFAHVIDTEGNRVGLHAMR
jgi:predicted enzyme related to lactoylglutathione lyase